MRFNLLRTGLFAMGAGLVAWAVIAAFFTDWFWVLIVIAMVLIIAGGLIRKGDEDCGYADTPFGLQPPYPGVGICFGDEPSLVSRETHTPLAALTVIEGGKQAVWPREAGAPE